MGNQRRIRVLAGLVACVVIGAGAAEAGVITPVGGAGTVTLSIRDAGGNDITDTYLPTWAPGVPLQTVFVVVNGGGTPSLAQWSTNAGNCTNFGSPTDLGPDFTFAPADGALTSHDCGGTAVIQVGTDSFVIPKDANGNGIPDSLEVFGRALTPGDDLDGDGLATYDETVRGFIIGGQHKRLNPTVKNLFAYLVKGQCGTSLLGGGATVFPVAGAGGLDANLVSLIPASATAVAGINANPIQFLGGSLAQVTTPAKTDEWVDHFVSFSLGGSGTTETWTYCNTANESPCVSGTVAVTPASNTPAAPPDDRVVNKNRAHGGPQKGVRITECATTSGTTPQGTGRLGNITTGKNEAIIYTDRIRRFVNSIGTKSAAIHYSTFDGVAWTSLENKGSGTPARNFIISKAMQYVLATEVGHDGGLIGDVNTNPSFPHLVAGSGDNMDEAMRAITSGSPSGVKFYIPSLFNNLGQSTFQLSAPVVD